MRWLVFLLRLDFALYRPLIRPVVRKRLGVS
jgi:hypothetical protein